MVSYNKLWKMLIYKNMSRIELIKEAKSVLIMAKMEEGQKFHMETLVKICKVLGYKLDDIADYEEM